MILFTDRGCPFAHRVLALFDQLECKPDLRELMIGEKTDELYQYSASGSVPLLVDGDLVFTESRVMLEYLAEFYEFESYPANLQERSLHRHAMAVVDEFLVPLLFGRAEVDVTRLDDALNAIEEATATVAPQPCLLAFHVAPIWLWFRSWRQEHAVTRAIQARRPLCDWLDATIQLDCLRRTAPDPAIHEDDMSLLNATSDLAAGK